MVQKTTIMKKGQTTVEFIIILVITMALFTFIALTVNQQMQAQNNLLRSSQAQNTVNAVISTAQTLYSEGSGSSRLVTITIPDGVEPSRTYVDDNYVNIGLYVGNDINDINGKSAVKLIGNLPTEPGTYDIPIEAKDGYVLVNPGALDASPTLLTFELSKGEIQTGLFTISNNGNEKLTIILVPNSDDLTINPDKRYIVLLPNETTTVNTSVQALSQGLHTGYINAIANFNQSIRIYIKVDAVD